MGERSNDDSQTRFIHHYETEFISTDSPPKRTPHFKSVPKEYWHRMKACERATERVSKHIRNHWGQTPIKAYLGRGDTSSGYHIKVKYKTVRWSDGTEVRPVPPIDEVRNKLPNWAEGSYKGVSRHPPVEVMQSEFTKTTECVAGDNVMNDRVKWNKIPGGVPK